MWLTPEELTAMFSAVHNRDMAELQRQHDELVVAVAESRSSLSISCKENNKNE